LGAGAVVCVAWLVSVADLDDFYAIGAVTLVVIVLIPSALALALAAWVTSRRDGKADFVAVAGGLVSLGAAGVLLGWLFL
jgi:hypothetical protein